MKLENTAAEIVAMMNKEAGEDYNMDQKAGLLISGERYGGRLLKNLKVCILGFDRKDTSCEWMIH